MSWILLIIMLFTVLVNQKMWINIRIKKKQSYKCVKIEFKYLFIRLKKTIKFQEFYDIAINYFKTQDLYEKGVESKNNRFFLIINKIKSYLKRFYNKKNFLYVYKKSNMKIIKSDIYCSNSNMQLSILIFAILNSINRFFIIATNSNQNDSVIRIGFIDNKFEIDTDIDISIRIFDIFKIFIYILINKNKVVLVNER